MSPICCQEQHKTRLLGGCVFKQVVRADDTGKVHGKCSIYGTIVFTLISIFIMTLFYFLFYYAYIIYYLIIITGILKVFGDPPPWCLQH